MNEERNALQRDVFPKLRKLCMEHGFRFQAIDLRWGVSEEAGLDQQTMNICLEEIERSQKVSPKPNFIVLLGDRYGWRPLPYEIPADEFEEIKSVISPSDKDFLFWEGDVLEDEQLKKREGWYCRDENAVPPVYSLKPRLVDYEENASDDEIKEARDLEYKDWENIENRLKSILLNAINELGWDKNDSRRFKYESSATEQEIIKGVLKLPEDGSLSEEHVFSFMRTIKGKKGIPFDDHSKDFFDFTASGTIDESAEEKLIALKAKIDNKLPSSNIFDYETEWEGKGVNKQHIKKLCGDVYSSLEKVINEQIDEFEDKDPLDIEIEAHKEFGKERCRFFIGREDIRAQIKNYLENPNPKPLIVYGESGSGKSALMAQSVEDLNSNFYETPVDNVIVRFIGATPESSDMRSLLESLSKQISRIYGEEDSIHSDNNELVQHFKERLNLANDEKPLLIFLDALDQLSDSENAHNLSWIPNELPENVHIVISTLKNIFQSSLENRIVAENTVEVLPLENNNGKDILDEWFKDHKRTLTDKQEAEVINKFEVGGLPLYLKLAFEESKLWKSYTPTPELKSEIKWMINNLFERLSRPENHGEMLVSRSLGYLSAAKNGLTEDEMLDILALDDDVFNLTTRFHEPTEDKLPVALWSRLYFDLEPYLTERSGDETSLMAFYHRQLGEVAKEKYLDNTVKKSRHQLIAEYFYKQDLSFEQNEELVYNVRKVSELPFQETYAESWDQLEETLTDLYFVEAKCAVGKTYELIKDYNLALDMHPDAQEEKQKRLEHEKRVDKYVKDLIAFSKGEIDHLDVIPSVTLFTGEKLKEEIPIINNNPEPLDCIKSFYQFVKSQSQALDEFGHMQGFCVQQAYNSADSGPVAETSKKLLTEYYVPFFIKNENCIPKYNHNPPILQTLFGHESRVDVLNISLDGKRAISGGLDRTLRVWDLQTGEIIKVLSVQSSLKSVIDFTPDFKRVISGMNNNKLCVLDLETGETLNILEGHTSYIKCVAITADGKRAVSGSRDETLRFWDLETGKSLGIFGGHINGVENVAIAADGKRAISLSNHNFLYIWDLETGNCIKTFEDYYADLMAVNANFNIAICGTHSTSTFTCGDANDTIRVWDLETGNLIKTITSTKSFVLFISADGKISITSEGNKLFFWDLEYGKLIKTIEGRFNRDSLAVTPDFKMAVSLDNEALRVWDLETGITKKQRNKKYMDDVITPDGKIILRINSTLGNCINGDKLCVLDNKSQKIINILDELNGTIMKFTVTADGRRAIVASSKHDSDSNISIWDLETGNCIKSLWASHKQDVNILAVTPDDKIAIIGLSMGYCKSHMDNIFLWNLETDERLPNLIGHTDSVGALAITPDGKKVISGSSDKSLRLWNLETGENIKTFKDHTSSISSIVVTSDGKKFISGSGDRTLRLWDIETGKMICVSKENNAINSLKIRADNCLSFSDCYDNSFDAHIINITPEFTIVTAKRLWLYGENGDSGFWDSDITANCQCGNRLMLSEEILNMIRKIENQYRKPNGWIADEAWDDPRLISECPFCHKKLKFNPFIVDNSEDEINNNGNLQKGSKAPDEDLNEPELYIDDTMETTKEKKKIKKSRWKFWK